MVLFFKKERLFWLALGVFVLALIPRLIDLGARPFWLDEVFTFQRASLPPGALVQDSFLNHHMPSFFLLLSPLVGLGHPQFWLRLPSAVFGALAVVMVFLVAQKTAGRLAGLIAALILGFSPTALAFSQEARSYTLEMLLILVALYGLIGLALDVPAAARPLKQSGARLHWALFAGASAVALDVLGDGFFWLVTGNVICLLLAVQANNRLQLLRNLLYADLFVAICCAPFYALMLTHQGQTVIQSVMWIPPLDLSRFWYNIGSVYFMHVADSVTFRFMDMPAQTWLLWLIDAGLVVAVAAAAWALRRRPALLAALGISFILLPAAFTVISLWRPILLPRYILWSDAPFAILAGIGAATLLRLFARPRLRLGLVGAAALLMLANMAPYYRAETKPRWDIAARMLANDVSPGDVVLLYDTGALPILRMYLPKGKDMVVLADSAGDIPHALQAEGQGKRVWVVFGHAGQSGNNGEWKKFYADTRVLGTPVKMQVAGKRIYIALYTPPGKNIVQD